MTSELAPPSGTVTFLFTDVESSTRLWEEHPQEMSVALERHDTIMRSAIEEHRGYVFSTAGDSFAASFSRTGDAVNAATDAQVALTAESWPPSTPVRVRMGLHVGVAQERDGDYFGAVVNRAARIMSAGHGGQVLASESIRPLVPDVELADLGEHRLKDLSQAERLFQLGPGSFPTLRTLDVARHNLPVERTPLVGRRAEIAEYVGLLEEHRLVTLLGIGGTGKTRVATAAAAEVADRFVDGVWFVDLIPASNAVQVAEAILDATGLQVRDQDLLNGLAEMLKARDVLLVLDNCEHVIDEIADLVDELLERTTDVRFLATSREPLQLPDERQVHVPSMEVAEDLASPSLQLLAAAAERVGVSIEAGDVANAARVCAHLDGLPLSLELAAAQLRQLSLAELVERLDSRFDLLTRGRPRRRRRQDSLAVVLQDTWEMLTVEEQELLLQLAAFPAAFDADDIDEISSGLNIGVPTATLAGLVDRSVVARDLDGRHHLLETVRLFAHQRWSERTDASEFEERHTQWILSRLRQHTAEEWHTSYELANWANSRYEDLRSTEDRLAGSERVSELVELLNGLTYSIQQQAGQRASAAIDRIDTYLDHLDLTTVQRALLELCAAGAGLAARRPDRTTAGAAAAVEGLGQSGHPVDLAAALVVASWEPVFRDLEAGLAVLHEAIDIAKSADAQVLADVALIYTANHLSLHGRHDDARAILEQARTRVETRPFDYACSNYYFVALATEAIENPEVACTAATDLQDELGVAGQVQWNFLVLLTAVMAASGNIARTQTGMADTRAALLETSNDDGLPDLLIPLAALAWKLDETNLARRLLTTVRHHQRPTANFLITIIYRQLRDQVGLVAINPVHDDSAEALLGQATTWLNSL